MSTLNLPWSMVADRDAGIKANASHVDDDFNAVKTAVDGKLDLDGSSVPTADISMNSHKITSIATPTASGDAATKGYVDSNITTLSGSCVKLSGNQTIAGTKTFSASPVVPAPTNNTDATTKKYVDDKIATCVKTTGNETIAGTKTFSSTISGSINGNAATVTNGVYTTGNQTIAGTKTFSSTISGSINGNAATVTNGVYTTGNQTIGGTKTFSSTISGSISGNAGTVTNGVYTTGNQTIGGTKTFSVSPVVPTASTSDNSQKAASTAFVNSFLRKSFSKNTPTLTQLSTSTSYTTGNISLNTSFLNYDYIAILISDSNGTYNDLIVRPTWEINWLMSGVPANASVILANSGDRWWAAKSFGGGSTNQLFKYSARDSATAIYIVYGFNL